MADVCPKCGGTLIKFPARDRCTKCDYAKTLRITRMAEGGPLMVEGGPLMVEPDGDVVDTYGEETPACTT